MKRKYTRVFPEGFGWLHVTKKTLKKLDGWTGETESVGNIHNIFPKVEHPWWSITEY